MGLRKGRDLVNVLIMLCTSMPTLIQLFFIVVNKELNEYSGKNESLELFSVDVGHSYSCKTETLYMGGGVSLDLTHNRFQAFDFKNNEFGPRKCRVFMLQYLQALHPCSG